LFPKWVDIWIPHTFDQQMRDQEKQPPEASNLNHPLKHNIKALNPRSKRGEITLRDTNISFQDKSSLSQFKDDGRLHPEKSKGDLVLGGDDETKKKTGISKLGKVIEDGGKTLVRVVKTAKWVTNEPDNIKFAHDLNAISSFGIPQPKKLVTYEPWPGVEPPHRAIHKRIARWVNAAYPLSKEIFPEYQGHYGISEDALKKLQMKQIKNHETARCISHRFLSILGINFTTKNTKDEEKINYIVEAKLTKDASIKRNIKKRFLHSVVTSFGVCIHSTLSKERPEGCMETSTKKLDITSTKSHLKNRFTVFENYHKKLLINVEIRDHNSHKVIELFKTIPATEI